MVMYLGQTIESRPRDDALRASRSTRTRGALLSAVPIADPALGRSRKPIVLEGDVPEPAQPAAGCRFHPRCPRFVDGKCDVDYAAARTGRRRRQPSRRVPLPARALADDRGRDAPASGHGRRRGRLSKEPAVLRPPRADSP